MPRQRQDLTHCQCFIDLALNETKERMKKLLAAAVDDWAHLARFTPPPQQQQPPDPHRRTQLSQDRLTPAG
jgi:hypothetical protein